MEFRTNLYWLAAILLCALASASANSLDIQKNASGQVSFRLLEGEKERSFSLDPHFALPIVIDLGHTTRINVPNAFETVTLPLGDLYECINSDQTHFSGSIFKPH